MGNYRIEIGVGLTGPLEQMLTGVVGDAERLFPNQARAVQALAVGAQRRWLEYATGKRPLPSGRVLQARSGAYASSIKIHEAGHLKYVIYSEDPRADIIENGASAWDMHKILATSDKVRVTKDGRKYLVIPFRHKTHGGLGVVMPQQAEGWWLTRDRASSVVSGHYTERSVNNPDTRVTRNTYIWGDRMTRQDVAGMGLDPMAEGRNLVGMVRFQNETDRAGQYMTFRVMVEHGRGWRMPQRPGEYPARAAYQWMQSHYDSLMQMALQEDIRRIGSLS